MENLEEFWIVLYISAWGLTLLYYSKKYKNFDGIAFIYSTYLFYSVCSLLLFRSQEYRFNEITLFPFVYLYISLYITSYPVRKYSTSNIQYIKEPSKLLNNTVCAIFIVSTLIYFPSTISKFKEGIILIMIDGTSELYNLSLEGAYKSGTGGITNLFAIFSEAFSTVGILFLFTILTKKKYNKLILLGLILSILSGIMTYISMGQRGGVFARIITLLVTYFAFKRFLSDRINRVVKKCIIVLSILIIILVAVMTISRFSTSTTNPLASTYYYIGQENLYFNNYGLDNNGIRYGDRTVPLFKQMMGLEAPNNFIERRAKYPNLKINDEVFISYIGDFTLDYGPFLAMIIFILFSVWATSRLIIKNKTIYFHQLVLVHFVMTMCAQGGLFLFSFGDIAGNLKIIVYVIVYVWSKLEFLSRTNNANSYGLSKVLNNYTTKK